MDVRDVMTRRPVTIRPENAISEARRLMHHHNVRHLPVVDGDRVVGIVSDRDVVVRDRALGDALTALGSELYSGRERRLRDVMSRDVVTVGPDVGVADAGRLLRRHRISALPVVDGGRLVGIVTTDDLLKALPEPDIRRAQVGETVACLAPLGPGDERPGRPGAVRSALVVDADVSSRIRRAEELSRGGYAVTTCPGPAAGVRCEALRADGYVRCPRVPTDVDLVVLAPSPYTTQLRRAYAEWAPDADVKVVGYTPSAPADRREEPSGARG